MSEESLISGLVHEKVCVLLRLKLAGDYASVFEEMSSRFVAFLLVLTSEWAAAVVFGCAIVIMYVVRAI